MPQKVLHTAAYFLVALMAIAAILAGVTSDVIDVDAAQYAAISMEMLQKNTFLFVTERGIDYLDKPPLLFWVNSLFLKIFGFTNFGYKIGTLLASSLTILYTYKLGKLLYTKDIGKVAACIVGTSIGFVWANNDVKTDAMMTAWIVISVFYLIRFLNENHIIDLLLASVGIGLGLMTKGPMGLIFPLIFATTYAAFRKEIRKFTRFSWLLLPVVVLVLIAPMLWGLYHQFDLQPDKLVNGRTGVSGLRFYFWEQSFGRVTGENSWRNNASFFFLFHALFLMLFPYTVLALVAYFRKFRKAFKTKSRKNMHLVISTMLILVLLSLSSYKIPHYTLVLFPFVALVIAEEWSSIFSSNSFWIRLHHILLAVVVFAFSLFAFWAFKSSWVVPIAVVIAFIILFVQIIKSRHIEVVFLTAVILGFVFNVHFVPSIQSYSEGRQLANKIQEKDIIDEPIYFYNRNSRSAEFYLQKRLDVVSWNDILSNQYHKKSAWYYMSLDGKESLLHYGFQVDEEIALTHYGMNRLELGFLNPKTREEYLEPRYLIRLKKEKRN
jgi:4-amino-4-deoxy-L-arabinose transferase-like glycosyltransferase